MKIRTINPIANITHGTIMSWSMARNWAHIPQNLLPLFPIPERIKNHILRAPEDWNKVLDETIHSRCSELQRGVEVYQNHPYQRSQRNPNILKTIGSCHLTDYSHLNPSLDSEAPIFVFVPSLINKSYIFDLKEGLSLAYNLAQNGIRPFSIDWGTPGDEESSFGIDEYITQRLMPLLRDLPPFVLGGFCMGGILGIGAVHLSSNIKGLVTLSTPWDFEQSPLLHKSLIPPLSQFISNQNIALSPNAQQIFFHHLYFKDVLKKFSNIQNLNSLELESFVALEDWINDCSPLSPKVANECLIKWYQNNQLCKGNWIINNIPINPQNLLIPTMSICPQFDKVTPYSSTHPLSKSFSNNTCLSPHTGHLGPFTKKTAPEEIWTPLQLWIHSL
jgi:polyhydroxyalkanoate synthase